MSEVLAVLAGVGLAAACGFRIFLPLFVASLAIQTGVDGFGGFSLGGLVGDDLPWLGTFPVTVAFGVATVLEIGAYYVPWIDNALDTIATPTAMVAGTLMSFAFLPGVLDDSYLKWIAAAIVGGGTAGVIQSGTVALRGTSTATTGGLGNFLLSTVEAIVATVTSVLAVFLPLLAGVVALVIAIYMIRKILAIRRWLRSREEAT
ncbi:DUF4126 domain-containing protein [Haloferula rosea]|uniref:DUF4126 domain-containing protein n=1 Tax=Haloferula rosea TaxID=490093 RepID=A0A934RAV1_9BACT|nr:DUF4126 domain-containing protein [Haloferula rosea]MBK1826227.1 DUF4126 domain-containing protein [Haloferula rosea]